MRFIGKTIDEHPPGTTHPVTVTVQAYNEEMLIEPGSWCLISWNADENRWDIIAAECE